MARYEVFATRYDDPHVVEQVPARGLSFSMPLSDHGECSFTATVEPGRSTWRPALTPPFSGVLVTRDGVPGWSGWLGPEQQTGPRTFSFRAHEWGSFFKTVPARVGTWLQRNDHILFRDQIFYGQLISGQDVQIVLGSTLGAAESDRTVNAWDNATAEEIFTQISDADGGPEWYFGTAGTLDEPVRQLVLGDRLGAVDAVDTLHYVEDTQDPQAYGAPPSIVLLSDLFPVGTTAAGLSRRGGNVLLPSRVRDPSRAATVVTAVGDGVEALQLRETATASRLLSIGWPRMTRWTTHSSVTRRSTLLRHAQGDLGIVAGIATGYGLATLDGDPDWTQVPRGSTMRVVLDTDVYGGNRPHVFESRLLNLSVDVPDDGGDAQVTWELAEVLEAA